MELSTAIIDFFTLEREAGRRVQGEHSSQPCWTLRQIDEAVSTSSLDGMALENI